LGIYGEALANGAAAWCEGQPTCSMTEAEWNLNFLAAYSRRPQGGVMKCVADITCDVASKVRPPSQPVSMSIVAGIQQRLPLGADPLSLDDPFSVGNISLSEAVLRKMIQKGMVHDAWGGGNTMVVLTLCQTRLYYYAAANDGRSDVNGANYANFCGK
jgi:hypothetical protein